MDSIERTGLQALAEGALYMHIINIMIQKASYIFMKPSLLDPQDIILCTTSMNFKHMLHATRKWNVHGGI